MAKDEDEPKAVGRPRRGDEPASSLSLRLTASERKQFEAAAAAKSMTLAEWIRAACAAFLKRRK